MRRVLCLSRMVKKTRLNCLVTIRLMMMKTRLVMIRRVIVCQVLWRCYCNRLPISCRWFVCFHAEGCVELVESRDQQAVPWKTSWLELLQTVKAEQIFVVVGVGN